MWPRCSVCNHLAEAHDYPPPEGTGKCDSDSPGQSCNCDNYTLPKDWVMVNGQPEQSKRKN